MALTYADSTPEDLANVRPLLTEAFHAPPDAPFADPHLLTWKYFDSGPQWEGSRGMVLRKDGVLAAHLAVCPIQWLLPEGNCVSSACYVDWAGGRALPGAGVLLMKRLQKRTRTAIVAGGSTDTRAAVPKLGFTQVGEIEFYARVVRPWKQFRSRMFRGVKDVARLARNTRWSWTAAARPPQAWQLTPVSAFPAGGWYSQASPAALLADRSPDLLHYWLRCPVGHWSGAVLSQDGRACGHVLLNRVAGQTRLVDLRVASDSPAEWQAAVALATAHAAQDPETVEVLGVASSPLTRGALQASGYIRRRAEPLFLHDPSGALQGQPPLHWDLINDDTSYLFDPAHPYAT